jgi:hypothetical protein
MTAWVFTSRSRPVFTTHSRSVFTRRNRPMFTTHSRSVFTKSWRPEESVAVCLQRIHNWRKPQWSDFT